MHKPKNRFLATQAVVVSVAFRKWGFGMCQQDCWVGDSSLVAEEYANALTAELTSRGVTHPLQSLRPLDHYLEITAGNYLTFDMFAAPERICGVDGHCYGRIIPAQMA